eukprot:TRINITY_DN828_c0_g2_i1.p1 TRINITY_DN828_c0_g2~~TRINITY_DN828_c0_g2_i1.p1  ORF type:complete len:386 (+),score=79.18 TRINITY_DN828_c0_g2_i1:35-1159(+)
MQGICDLRVQLFEDLLREKKKSEGFKKYMEKQLCQENLEFYYEIEDFRSQPKDVQTRAKEIVAKYFEKSSEYELNIKHADRVDVMNRYTANKFTSDMFDRVQRSIYYEMLMDHFPRFLQENPSLQQELMQSSAAYLKEFHKAVKNGNVSEMQKLLAESPRSQASHVISAFQRTWLHIAASEGHIDIVRYLISTGESVNVASAEGWTPLHEAASEGHLLICSELISGGADVTAKSKEGTLPLHYLVGSPTNNNNGGSGSNGKLLFEEVFEACSNSGKLVNEKNTRQETPLHYAVRANDASERVALLLNSRADVNVRDKRGNTPLHHCVWKKRKDLARQLLEAGASVDIKGSLGTCHDLAKTDEEMVKLIQAFQKR